MTISLDIESRVLGDALVILNRAPLITFSYHGRQLSMRHEDPPETLIVSVDKKCYESNGPVTWAASIDSSTMRLMLRVLDSISKGKVSLTFVEDNEIVLSGKSRSLQVWADISDDKPPRFTYNERLLRVATAGEIIKAYNTSEGSLVILEDAIVPYFYTDPPKKDACVVFHLSDAVRTLSLVGDDTEVEIFELFDITLCGVKLKFNKGKNLQVTYMLPAFMYRRWDE